MSLLSRQTYVNIFGCRRQCNCIPPQKISKQFSTRYSHKNIERTVDSLATNIISNDGMNSRIALSKAITLVESRCNNSKRQMADKLLARLKKQSSENETKPSFRLGIAGPPGVGKSTVVEALGMYILEKQEKEKLAILCIDPSSHITGGSILGDKTRMSKLSYHPNAYVRPSPSSGTLGGLGSYTYDAGKST